MWEPAGWAESTWPWVSEVTNEVGSPGGIGTPTCLSQDGTQHRSKVRRVRMWGHQCQASSYLPDIPRRENSGSRGTWLEVAQPAFPKPTAFPHPR